MEIGGPGSPCRRGRPVVLSAPAVFDQDGGRPGHADELAPAGRPDRAVHNAARLCPARVIAVD